VFDDEEREAFIGIIDEQLPEGYSVSPPLMDAGSLWSPAFDDGNKRAYLVPNENAEAGTYYVYYVDDVNELRPLIYENNGELFLPMFDKSDLKDFYAKRSQERQEEIEDRLDGKEQMLKALRKRPGIRR
jgi:hypothetical protein